MHGALRFYKSIGIGLWLLFGFNKVAFSLEQVEEGPFLTREGTTINESIIENPTPVQEQKKITLFTSGECVFCCDGEASFTIIPCGHQCMCESCSAEARYRFGCPICRASMLAIYGPQDLALYQKGELKPEPREYNSEEESADDSDADCCISVFGYLCSCFFLTLS